MHAPVARDHGAVPTHLSVGGHKNVSRAQAAAVHHVLAGSHDEVDLKGETGRGRERKSGRCSRQQEAQVAIPFIMAALQAGRSAGCTERLDFTKFWK